ncbi:MAG: SDR family NAD(P)-dependent oxidoreductase [Porticoccaceae bacterium]|nr:SDR family NAD(P)-dependent oxidoreductase [Pseudomonadales bacterium]MCP5172208.1 SDR family NAD(P)-dependent oxidoreductase [Pseudomonadales bacterium]
MQLNLKNKTVLITGGSKGIGLACAKVFKAEGARVAIVARTATTLAAAKALLGEVYTVAADLTDPAAAAAVIKEVEKNFGNIDILVNSAGAANRTVPEELNPEIWRAAMDAKYFSYINVIDPLIKLMAQRQQGAIINVIGTGGKTPAPTHLAGGAANAALMLVTTGLASAYAEQGVRVIGINPGLTRTERVNEGLIAEAKRLGMSEEDTLTQLVQNLPLKRLAEPEEIANLVAFAASNHGQLLTGSNLTADGAATPFIV